MRETEKNDLSLSICVNREYRKNCISAAPRRWGDATAFSLLGVQKGVSHARSPISLLLPFPILPTTHPSVPSSMILPMSSSAFQFPCCLLSWLCHALRLPPPRAPVPPPPSLPSLLLQCRVMDAHGLYAYLLHAVSSYNLSAQRRAGWEMKLEEDWKIQHRQVSYLHI